VESYDLATGLLTLTEALDYYHFGGSDTSGDYNGLDMRCEVALLTRNVKVEGEDTDGWGG